jgi:mRNA interferase HicA
MQWQKLLKHLKKHGCRYFREGANHTIWETEDGEREAAIPRHEEIKKFTARGICRQLGIPDPE